MPEWQKQEIQSRVNQTGLARYQNILDGISYVMQLEDTNVDSLIRDYKHADAAAHFEKATAIAAQVIMKNAQAVAETMIAKSKTMSNDAAALAALKKKTDDAKSNTVCLREAQLSRLTHLFTHAFVFVDRSKGRSGTASSRLGAGVGKRQSVRSARHGIAIFV
jgi:hypothetical protein